MSIQLQDATKMPSRRRTWEQYPLAYLEVIKHFASGKTEPFILPMPTRQDAWTIRTQFYRFWEAIRIAYDKATVMEQCAPHTGISLHQAYWVANNTIHAADPKLPGLRFRLHPLADELMPDIEGIMRERITPAKVMTPEEFERDTIKFED